MTLIALLTLFGITPFFIGGMVWIVPALILSLISMVTTARFMQILSEYERRYSPTFPESEFWKSLADPVRQARAQRSQLDALFSRQQNPDLERARRRARLPMLLMIIWMATGWLIPAAISLFVRR